MKNNNLLILDPCHEEYKRHYNKTSKEDVINILESENVVSIFKNTDVIKNCVSEENYKQTLNYLHTSIACDIALKIVTEHSRKNEAQEENKIYTSLNEFMEDFASNLVIP